MSKINITLGDEVRDIVSGFQGVAFGKTEFLNGCTRWGIQPPVGEDRKLPEAAWFDEPQLEIVLKGKAAPGPKNTGGPMVSIPTRPACPSR